MDVAFTHAVLYERRRARGEQPFSDVVVEAAHDDADREFSALAVGLQFIDVVEACHEIFPISAPANAR